MQWGMMKAGAAVAISILSLSISGCSQVSSLSGKMFGQSAKEQTPPLGSIMTVIYPKFLWQHQLDFNKKIKNENIPLLTQGNMLYGAGGNSVNALDKTTGRLIWKENLGERITGGIKGTSNTIFVGTHNGSAIALNAKTGRTEWVALLNSPILSISNNQDDKIAFRTLNGKVHLLSSRTGDIIWQRSHKTPTLSLKGASSPILTGPLLVTGADDGTVTAYATKNANKIWSIATTNSSVDQASKLTDIDAEMKVVGTTLFTTGYHGRISAIDMRSGKTGWSLPLSTFSSIDANQEALYVADETGKVSRLGLLTGKAKWENNRLLRRQLTAPVIVNPALIAVADKEGYVHWIETRLGRVIGRLQAAQTPILLPPTVDGADSKILYTVNEAGVIHAYGY